MEMLPTIRHSLTDSVKKELQRYICSMDLKSSTKLPPESVIATNFGVSRVTVRHVLSELEQDNVIFRIHGKGTFVNPEALQIKVGLNPALEFRHLIEISGYRARTKMMRLERDKNFPQIATKLLLPPETPLLWIEKIYYADDHPAILCFNYFDMKIFPELPTWEDFENISSFFLLRERAGHVLLRDRIEIQARAISEIATLTDQANCFDSKALLQFDTINYDQHNQPVMFGVNFFNTKYIRYNLIRAQDVY